MPMNSKEKIKERQEQLIRLTSDFCNERINAEYGDLCEKLIQKMGRKREVPFQRGRLEIWAAAVVHTIGSINFLGDKSFEPYLTVSEIYNHFGASPSSVSQKSKLIQELFELWYYNPEFSTSKMTDNSPFNSMVLVDGFIVPVESLPEAYQQLVSEARNRGEDISFVSKSSQQNT